VGDDGAIVTALFSRSDDRIVTSLTVDDKALLVQIPDLLASVGTHDRDPAVAVMNRPAYADDAAASDEFDELIGTQRTGDHAADIAALDVLLRGESSMSLDEAESVLRVINRARLTLAARAGVFESGAGWEARISDDAGLAAVAWLGYLQSDLLSALTDSQGANW
jgi:hypothetical protein